MKYMNYVYAVNLNTGLVTDIAKDTKTMNKRISLRKEPYPEGTVFVRSARMSPLVSLQTDEQIGRDFVQGLFVSATIAGVDARTAYKRAVDAGFVKEVPFHN